MHLSAEDSEPQQTASYFIAAELQDADRLQMEMLAREFSQLLNSILRKAAETIDQFGGVVVQSGAIGITGCFVGVDTNQFTPMTLVQCALELRSKMADLDRQWKLRKGWQRRIELNVGLHYSYEYLGTVNPSSPGSLTIFGDGLNKACRIASMGDKGEIWASKELISAMPQDEMDRVQFGLHRSGRSTASIIKNGFSRIEDLVSTEGHRTGLQPALVVTQIFDAHS
jgi:class 3 adenylate cyclase